MKTKLLGEIVLQRRKDMGVPQKTVCEGLCTIMTLSRFENGQQTPSWDCTAAILQRLDLPDEHVHVHLTREEMRLKHLRKEIDALYGRFAKTLGEEREQVRIQALDKLRDLEHQIKGNDRINQQFIQMIQAILGPCSLQDRLEMLMEAIYLTSPRFNLNEIDRCLYCTDEVNIINQIAVTYSLCGQRSKAIEIYGQLLRLIQKRSPNHKYLPLTAYNYAYCLALEYRLKEALKISELGRQACIKQEHYYLLPKFLHVEAVCFYFAGETGRSEESYRSAYHIYGSLKNTNDQEILKAATKKYLNLVF